MKYTSLLWIGIALMLSSCSHYYYVAPPKTVPLFKEKNEYRASIGVGDAEEMTILDVQAAYSITDHIAISASYMKVWGGTKDAGNWGEGNYYDVALGYYTPITDLLMFEVFGGIGSSKQHHQYEKDKGTSDLAFTNFYIQPTLGISLKRFDFAFSPTFSLVRFGKVDQYLIAGALEKDKLNAIANNRNSVNFEPCFTVRGGFDYVKIQLQIMSSSNLSNPDQWYDFSRGSVGLQFAFAERFLKKRKTTQQ